MSFKAYGDWFTATMEAGVEASRHVASAVERVERFVANPPRIVVSAEAGGKSDKPGSWVDFATRGKVLVEVHPPDETPAKKFRASFDENGLKLEEISDV